MTPPLAPIPDNPISKTLNGGLTPTGPSVKSPLSKLPQAPLPDNPIAHAVKTGGFLSTIGHGLESAAQGVGNIDTAVLNEGEHLRHQTADLATGFGKMLYQTGKAVVEPSKGPGEDWGTFLRHPIRSFEQAQAAHDPATQQISGWTKGQLEFAKTAVEHPGRNIPADILVLGSALGLAHGAGKLAAKAARTDLANHVIYDQSGEIRPFHSFAENKVAANLKLKQNPRLADAGIAKTPKTYTSEGLYAHGGNPTYEEWKARNEAMLPTKAERNLSAKWYQDFEPLMRKHFPPEVADKVMRAFAVSQANASPLSGLASTLVAHSRLDRGDEVGSIGSVVASNIEKALKGEKIDSHVAAKLSDFIDALRGSKTRTWMGHDVQGMMPAPIDIWGQRDLGHLDAKLLQREGPKGQLVAQTEARHGLDFGGIKKSQLSPGSASGGRYERLAELYNHFADRMNAENYDGRSDWTPAEAQALGWHSIQKFWGREPLTLEEAITRAPGAAKVIEKNSDFRAAVENAKQPDGGFTMHSDLSADRGKDGFVVAHGAYEKRIPAAEFTGKDIRAYAREHAKLLRDPNLRVGGWHNPADGNVYLDISRVLPTREEAMAFARENGQLSVFDRATAARGDWANAFPESGLSKEAADAIKATMREKAAAPQRYDALLEKYARQEFGRTGAITPLDRQYAEEALHGWADAHPDHPQAQAFKKLYNDAQDVKDSATPSPESLFGRVIHEQSGAVTPGAFLPGARRVMSDPEAKAVVDAAAKDARDAGYGVRNLGVIPRLEKGEQTPETGGQLGADVRKALAGAPRARSEQNALQKTERRGRVGQYAGALEQGSGATRFEDAMHALGGQYPRVDFQGFKHFDQATLDGLADHIATTDRLRPLEKGNAFNALKNAVEGVVPQPHEQQLLERVFGREVGQQISDAASFFAKARRLSLDLLNVPRSVMASTDLSAPFRQGLVAGVAYPKIFFKNFNSMIKAFGSEQVFQGTMHGIYDDPWYSLAHKAQLAITDIGEHAGGAASLNQREEQFASNLAEKIPLAGHLIRASDRAYVGFLDKVRMDVFKQLLQQAASEGEDLTNEKLIKDIATFVNSATGRGDLKLLNNHTAAMNALFFSPRLLYSRLNFMSPAYYMRLDPFARRQALRAGFRLAGTLATVLTLAKLGGASVNADPRNADWGKIRMGNTRIDIAGGFTQPLRLLAQLASGKVVSSTTGKTLTLGPEGPGKLSRFDIGLRFVEGKLAPIPSMVVESSQQKQFGGQKFSWGQEAASRFLPLLIQDGMQLGEIPSIPGTGLGGTPDARGKGSKAQQALAGAGLLAADLFGVGVQSYAPKAAKSSRSSSGGGGYGGGSSGGYGGGGSYGSSSSGGY